MARSQVWDHDPITFISSGKLWSQSFKAYELGATYESNHTGTSALVFVKFDYRIEFMKL